MNEEKIIKNGIEMLYKKMALISYHLNSFEAFINKLSVEKERIKSSKNLTSSEKLNQLNRLIDSVSKNFDYQIDKIKEHITPNQHVLSQDIKRANENRAMRKKYQEEEAIRLGFSPADKFKEFNTAENLSKGDKN